MRRTQRSWHPPGQQLDDPSSAARSRKSKTMVVIADSFRARWEAEDEFRKIGEREAYAEWLSWLPSVKPSTEGAMSREAAISSRGGVRESDP